jgi:hypothetical protein
LRRQIRLGQIEKRDRVFEDPPPITEAEERSVAVSPALAKKRLAGMKRRKPKTLIIVFANAMDASWTRYSHGYLAMASESFRPTP